MDNNNTVLSEQLIKVHSKPTNITHLYPATVGMATEIGSRPLCFYQLTGKIEMRERERDD